MAVRTVCSSRPEIIAVTDAIMSGGYCVVSIQDKKGVPAGTPISWSCNSESYLMMISTRRFCGSRTPAPVGTSGWVSPKPWIEMALFGTPSLTSSAATA